VPSLLAEEEILLQSGTIETIKRHMCLPDANDHFLDSDGDMSRYFIDKEHTSSVISGSRHFLINTSCFMK
jgi:hypothetical protein